MASTQFLDNLLARQGETISIGTSVSRGGIDSIAGTNELIESDRPTIGLINNARILSLGNVLSSARNLQGIQKNLDLASQNLVDLGESQVNLSEALNQNIQIRESQRQADLEFAQQIQGQINETNERLSGQITQLGQAVVEQNQKAEESAQGGGFLDAFKLPTGDDIKKIAIIGGIGIVALFGGKALLGRLSK